MKPLVNSGVDSFDGETKEVAAAKSGMSAKTARKYLLVQGVAQ